MNNQSFSKIWIAVILLALIVGGILTWQYLRVLKEGGGTPGELVEDETVSWKTHNYNNGEDSYSFRYPYDWIIINGSGIYNVENSPTIGLENKNVKDFDSIGYGIGLTSPTITIEDLAFYHKNSTTGINPKGPYVSIDNFIASIKNSKNDKIFEEKNVTIAGKIFRKILRGYPNAQKYEYLISYSDNSLFVAISTPVINKELNTGEKINNIKIIEKILETFKFTK